MRLPITASGRDMKSRERMYRRKHRCIYKMNDENLEKNRCEYLLCAFQCNRKNYVCALFVQLLPEGRVNGM